MNDPFQIVGTALEGKYRVEQLVGEGGFGVVYRGYHLSFKQPIAVKCLKVPAHFTPDARELFLTKFREEGEHLARLGEHGSITRVYDFGIVEGATPIPYLVLEWLDGEDLQQLLARRSAKGQVFSEIEALQLLRPAIDALSLAHDLGIAHRDVKPPNLFWAKGKRGRVLKVLDFGIAKAMAEGDTATQVATRTSSGFSAFSPAYGAPEQFRSKKFGATGPWTDVHAIGLMLAEMVAGRAAFEGDEMIEFYEQCSKETRPTPRALGAEVSDAFEALCQKALALVPKDRFATAGEMLALVDGLLEGKPPLVLEESNEPAETKVSLAEAAREPLATVARAPLELPEEATSPATVVAEPLPALAGSGVVGEPLKVRSASRVEPVRTSPAWLAMGGLAIIAVVAGVVYALTREPASDTSHVAPLTSAAPTPSPATGLDSGPPTDATVISPAPEAQPVPSAAVSASTAPAASSSSRTGPQPVVPPAPPVARVRRKGGLPGCTPSNCWERSGAGGVRCPDKNCSEFADCVCAGPHGRRVP